VKEKAVFVKWGIGIRADNVAMGVDAMRFGLFRAGKVERGEPASVEQKSVFLERGIKVHADNVAV
jgi:hypothetical protein